MAEGGPPLEALNPPAGGLSISSSSIVGGITVTSTGPAQLISQNGNPTEFMMATNIATSTSTSPTPSDSTSVSAESGRSALAGR